MQDAHGQFHVFFVDDDGNLDFGGGDHLDIDAIFREGLEHFAGNADVGAHADTDQGYFGSLVFADDFACADVALHLAAQQVQRFLQVVLVHGEGEVGGAVGGDVLDDDVDVDISFCNRPQDLVGDAWAVRDAQDSDFGFVAFAGLFATK